jgi:hypothetical protein
MNEIQMPLTNLNYLVSLHNFIESNMDRGAKLYLRRGEHDVLSDYLLHCCGYLANILAAGCEGSN